MESGLFVSPHSADYSVGEVSWRTLTREAQLALDPPLSLGLGDVLIAPFTSPSFNSVLPIVDVADIRDGETVEVDAASGVVRRVST